MYKYAILFCCFIYSTSYADVPQFDAYPAEIYQGKNAKLKIDNPTARMFRTRFRNALRDGQPDFAGEYTLVSWGCGAMCVMHSFVNLRTGRVLEHGFGGELGESLDGYQADSRLLIASAHEDHGDPDKIKFVVKYYELKNHQLRLIDKVYAKKPQPVEKVAEPPAESVDTQPELNAQPIGKAPESIAE